MDPEFELKRQKSKEKELTRLFQCLRLQYTGFFILTCHKLITWFESSTPRGRGGGGVLPYMGYIGTCRGIGYSF